MRLAIIAVGYNREKSLYRLLDSLQKADYYGDIVDLIISLDRSNKSNEIIKYLEQFNWNFGEKKILTYCKNLGLRKHILKCGEFTKFYDAIAVFEDDIYLSPSYYNYFKQAYNYYKSNKEIAGVSFYNHQVLPDSGLNFIPEKNGYDNFFIKYAMSWGQIWFKDTWDDFIEWYEKNSCSDSLNALRDLPDYVRSWSENSWLKYHIAYCCAKNKYFVYPYYSLSTNFSDLGEHCTEMSSLYQTPMEYGSVDYSFVDTSDINAVKYDTYFERENLGNNLNIKNEEICIDIYGNKERDKSKKYWLTTKKVNFKILDTFGLNLKPHEMNIIRKIDGNDIFLYDTEVPFKNRFSRHHRKNCLEYYLKINNSHLIFELLY